MPDKKTEDSTQSAPELPSELSKEDKIEVKVTPGSSVKILSTEPETESEPKQDAEPEQAPEPEAEPVEETEPGKPIDEDSETDKAVEDIVSSEGDLVLAVEDARRARTQPPEPKSGGFWKAFKAFFWMIITVAVVLIIGISVLFLTSL